MSVLHWYIMLLLKLFPSTIINVMHQKKINMKNSSNVDTFEIVSSESNLYKLIELGNSTCPVTIQGKKYPCIDIINNSKLNGIDLTSKVMKHFCCKHYKIYKAYKNQLPNKTKPVQNPYYHMNICDDKCVIDCKVSWGNNGTCLSMKDETQSPMEWESSCLVWIKLLKKLYNGELFFHLHPGNGYNSHKGNSRLTQVY